MWYNNRIISIKINIIKADNIKIYTKNIHIISKESSSIRAYKILVSIINRKEQIRQFYQSFLQSFHSIQEKYQQLYYTFFKPYKNWGQILMHKHNYWQLYCTLFEFYIGKNTKTFILTFFNQKWIYFFFPHLLTCANPTTLLDTMKQTLNNVCCFFSNKLRCLNLLHQAISLTWIVIDYISNINFFDIQFIYTIIKHWIFKQINCFSFATVTNNTTIYNTFILRHNIVKSWQPL